MTSPAPLNYESHPPSRVRSVASRARSVVRGLLLAFVLVSIGFALGKEVTMRSFRAIQAGGTAPPPTAPAADKIIVYYLHAQIRCVTCNKIEKMARELVQREYAPDLRSGRVEWRTANFQKEEELAKRYDIASSSVVLVRTQAGREVEFRRLDDVWKLSDDPAAFNAYMGDALAAYVRGGRP